MRYVLISTALISMSFSRAFAGTGYAGSPAPEVTTVQGISGATPLNVNATIQPTNNPLTNSIISNNVPSLVVTTPSADQQTLLMMEANTRMMIQDEPESSQKQGFEIQ